MAFDREPAMLHGHVVFRFGSRAVVGRRRLRNGSRPPEGTFVAVPICPHLRWNQRPVAAYTAPRNGFSDARSKPATISCSHGKAKVTRGHDQGTSTYIGRTSGFDKHVSACGKLECQRN